MNLVHLSAEAHKQALTRGSLTPAERYEFSHLPMVRVNGIPVFDENRMRSDQVDETCARLEQITGRVQAQGVREMVETYMAAYGRFGLRVKDICDAVSASKPIVLKYLRELADGGRVVVKEENTRGATGSKRKRYFWTENELSRRHADPLEDENLAGLAEVTDARSWKDAPGIIHHGCSVYGLVCTCLACRGALISAFEGEERTAALRRGETGLSVGLELRRVRREAAVREDGRLLAAGLAARNG